MKKVVVLLAMANMAAFAADEYTLADGVLTFNVDVADYPEAAPYEYTTALSGVTSIVKKGTGADGGNRRSQRFASGQTNGVYAPSGARVPRR